MLAGTSPSGEQMASFTWLPRSPAKHCSATIALWIRPVVGSQSGAIWPNQVLVAANPSHWADCRLEVAAHSAHSFRWRLTQLTRSGWAPVLRRAMAPTAAPRKAMPVTVRPCFEGVFISTSVSSRSKAPLPTHCRRIQHILERHFELGENCAGYRRSQRGARNHHFETVEPFAHSYCFPRGWAYLFSG